MFRGKSIHNERYIIDTYKACREVLTLFGTDSKQLGKGSKSAGRKFM